MELKIPVEFGTTYYVPRHMAVQKQIPCPVCAGKREVELIDGYGVSWMVDCEACGRGYEGSQGTITEYVCEPAAVPFTPVKLSSMHGEDSIYVADLLGEIQNVKNLFADRAEAEAQSKKLMEAWQEDNHKRSAHIGTRAKTNAAWSVRYHNECIKKAQRQIEWHLSKVRAKQCTKK